MDEAEVERVARLMHAAFSRHIDGRPGWGPSGAWESLTPRAQDAHLAVARAVLADLCPAPLVVTS